VSGGQVRGRVLIVDDDPFTRAMLGSVVQGLGFEVTGSAGTFAEALTLARQSPAQVALIDLDLGEGPDGISLAHVVRRMLPLAGIVVQETPTSLVLQTPTERITLSLADVDERHLASQSLMPENQLAQLAAEAARDLVAYLRHPTQVPLPANAPP
jgi:CheY-like chemotaxis protein